MKQGRRAIIGEQMTLLEQAKALYSEGKLEESELVFKRVIASGDDTAEGFYGVGLVRGSKRDWNGAATNFEQAVQQNPRHANAIYQLGFIAEKRSRVQEAQAYYRMALVANPQHVGARMKLEKLTDPKLQGDPHDVEKEERRGGSAPAQPLTSSAGPQPASSPSLQWPTVRNTMASADDAIVGVVRGFRQRSEADYPFSLFPWQIWVFQVERRDEAGTRLPPAMVQMRGHFFEGVIDEGDEIEVTGRWRVGETAHAKEVYNRTKGVFIRARERPGSRLDRNLQSHTLSVAGRFIIFVFVFAVFLLVAWVFWQVMAFQPYGP